MIGRHMITATQATREAGVRFGRVTARSTVSRWMANTPTATIAPTRSLDAPVITAPYPQRSTRRPYRSMRYGMVVDGTLIPSTASPPTGGSCRWTQASRWPVQA